MSAWTILKYQLITLQAILPMYTSIITFFLCLHLVKASSFYDNPEQDSLPLQDTPEDLHNKWDFEVWEQLHDHELRGEI